MTIGEARRIARDYYDITNPTEEDSFLFTEALNFLYDVTRDPVYASQLGGWYYEHRDFDLALKYYELAAEDGEVYAICSLGYVWYYGRTGVKDYEKAFYYYDKARSLGNLQAAYKVADMYKNGYFVEKDYEKYRQIVEELYPKVINARRLNDPLPEVFTRLAKIRADEGRTREALDLYDRARDFLAERIRNDPFFGDLTIMKWLILDTYKLREFDRGSFDLFDLYELLREPVKVGFSYFGDSHEIEAVEEDGAIAVRFDDAWFRSVDAFFAGAELDGEKLMSLYEDIEDLGVIS